MNKKQLLLPVLMLFLMSSYAYAKITDIDLNKLSVEKDIKKYENKEYQTPKEYIQAQKEGKCSSVWVWMHIDRESKIKLIDGLKQMFKEKDNVIINQSSEYYVDELDELIAKDSESKNYKLKILLTTIAVMDYDFQEDGVDKDETARKWLGSASIEIIKANMGVK
jgi:hypothetical protein